MTGDNGADRRCGGAGGAGGGDGGPKQAREDDNGLPLSFPLSFFFLPALVTGASTAK